jgi:hypothetical protein
MRGPRRRGQERRVPTLRSPVHVGAAHRARAARQLIGCAARGDGRTLLSPARRATA